MSQPVRLFLSRTACGPLALLVSAIVFVLGANPTIGQVAAPATVTPEKNSEPLKLDAVVVPR